MKVLVPELMHPVSLQRLRVEHDVHFDPTLYTRTSELLHAAQDADVLIVRNRTQVKGELLRALHKCKAVGRLGVGLDNIDVQGCKNLGIEVIPAYGANARSVAEYVITCAMLLLRYSHYTVSDSIGRGLWTRPKSPEGFEIAGKTMGLIGFGSIGKLTGLLASRLDMRVIAYDPSASHEVQDYPYELVALDELLSSADVVSVHIPLNEDTRGLLDEVRLSKMWPGAILINAARGGIVDESALATALQNQRISAAALDVFDDEPLPSGSILSGVPNLLLTPHIAGVTADSELRVCQLIADRVLALAQVSNV